MNRFLRLLATQIPTLDTYIWGGGRGGGALILDRCRAFDLFACVDAHLCPQLPVFHFDVDPDADPAFHYDVDPDPTSQYDADPCESGSGSVHWQVLYFFVGQELFLYANLVAKGTLKKF
jgi:hypothetical protein